MRNTGQSKTGIFPAITENKPSEPLLSKAKKNPAQLVLDELCQEEVSRSCGFTWSILCCLPSFGGSIGCWDCEDRPYSHALATREESCCSIWPGCLSLKAETDLKSLKSVLEAISADYKANAVDFTNAYQQTKETVNKHREGIGKYYTTCFGRIDVKLAGIQNAVESIENYHSAIEEKPASVSPN
ncbi:MAG: hypothetical protein P1U63_08340 [Coxiellaceae bacterium]|nr:hypothetical protein [Coxiellaceae bacterium]